MTTPNSVHFSHDIDQVENLNDELSRTTIAKTIANEIRNHVGIREAKVVGVYGWWGSGKSYLLSQVIHSLLEENKDSQHQVLICTYKAWQYEIVGDLAPGLIKSLVNMEKKFKNGSVLAKPETYKSIGNYLLELLTVVGPVMGPTGQASALFSQLALAGIKNIEDYKKALAALSPQQNIDEVRCQMEKLAQAILKSAKSKDDKKSYRLAIFIDDLDRCSPENMVRMFEWLKVHLSVDGCTFILALDNVAAAKAIVGRYKEYLGQSVDLEYGFRYLEKLIDSEYELGSPTEVEKMAIRQVYEARDIQTIKEIVRSQMGDFPGIDYIDNLANLRSLRIPRTMLKIVQKYRKVLDILRTNYVSVNNLRNDLGLAYPLWALLLVSMYYRLDPDVMDDFIRARGNIFRLINDYQSVPEDDWSDNPASPLHEFCRFAHGLNKLAGASLTLPKDIYLQRLAAIIRENAYSDAT